MSQFGRNFTFRIPPEAENNRGRFYADGAAIVLGAPVVASGNVDAVRTSAVGVELAAADTPKPLPGRGGIVVAEPGFTGKVGYDPLLFSYSDVSTVAANKMCKVVSGQEVKVVFTNTTAQTFLGVTDYPGRIMVAGVGATPTLQVGDLLTPGDGDDTNGYWKKTSVAANGWLVVTAIDAVNKVIEAQFTF